VCLLLCIRDGLCGFVPVEPSGAADAVNVEPRLLSCGDGSLEEGISTALQNIGGERPGCCARLYRACSVIAW
jgi:hypothetical protein